MPFGSNDWLALTTEPTLEPELPICDPHHHFWDFRTARHPYQRYLLHELAEGPADRSYGLAVARLAGVPAPVVARAKAVLDKLEKGRAETGGLAAGLGDLPLFAAAFETREEAVDQLRERLHATELDALSPREALELLYELKRDL